METLRHPIFTSSFILFGLNQLLELGHIFIWPLYTHLDDLLCLPITLTVILAAERLYFANPYFVLPKRYILSTVFLFSVTFEALLPAVASKYTSDVWDVVAYAVGALLFQVSINRRALPGSIKSKQPLSQIK